MTEISAGRLKSYRRRTFRLAADSRLKSVEEALQFVNERGFVYLWPIKGAKLHRHLSGKVPLEPELQEHLLAQNENN